VVRRRALTATGAAVVALAIAGTVGVLAPRAGDTDTLPALPTPTATPTPEDTPTITPSASASASASVTATPTSTATATPSATPTETDEPAQPGTPSATPSRSATPKSTWSDPVVVDGVRYTARVVHAVYGDRDGFKVEVRANGSLAYTRDDANGEHSLWVRDDKTLVFAAHVGPLSDVVSENGQPVSGESFRSITMDYPEPRHGYKGRVTITMIKLPRAATVDGNDNVVGMVVRTRAGEEITYCVGYCSPGG
jgi:hypothetical protein